jgi:hypothetical protein
MPRVRIDGIVDLDDETSHEEFLDLFLEWIAEQGWEFDGQTVEVPDSED